MRSQRRQFFETALRDISSAFVTEIVSFLFGLSRAQTPKNIAQYRFSYAKLWTPSVPLLKIAAESHMALPPHWDGYQWGKAVRLGG